VSSAAAAPLAEVVGISEAVELSPTGDIVEYYEVRFRTRSGIESSFRVPKSEFSVEKVRQMLKQLAEQLEQVRQLKV